MYIPQTTVLQLQELHPPTDFYFLMSSNHTKVHPYEKEIKLEGVSAKGMHFLLDYAYTSRLALNLSNIQDVLSAASHVQVVTVVEACSSYLQVIIWCTV